MNTTSCDLNGLPEADLARVSGGGDSFARDAGQFIGGMLGYVRDNTMLFGAANMILPPAGLLMAIAAGVKTAVEN